MTAAAVIAAVVLEDVARSVVKTTDGYVVAGHTRSLDGDVIGNHGDYDYWIVHLNSSLQITWKNPLPTGSVLQRSLSNSMSVVSYDYWATCVLIIL